ncbi:unnamed protein product [Paramecium octaurelia]|uniref:Uncharacterized protein n=1 Tax=Paramecium octaurelia TaxID=43137 RepID=A0A8S1VMS3_PAROT|nr:unnamed protein product [Paramecium octaurelia]
MNKIQKKMNFDADYQKIQEEKKSRTAIESEISIGNKPKGSNFMRLIQYSWKHKLLLFLGNFGLLVTSLSMVALPYLTGQMIDSITKSDGKEDLNKLTFYFIILTIVSAIFTFVRAYAYNILGEKITFDLRNELFQKLITKDIEFFDSNRSGELISRLSSDISVINKGANDSISMILKNAVQFIGSLILLWFISWNLTLVLFCVIPPFTIIVILFVRSYKKLTKEYQQAVAASTQIASEVLGNMRIVRSFSTEDKEGSQYKNATSTVYGIGNKIAILGSQFMSIGILLGYAVILAILYYGGSLVIEDQLTIGDLSSFVLYTLTMTISILAVSGFMNQMISAAAVSEKIFSIMDHPVKIQNGSLDAQQITGEITLKNVTFQYPTKSNVTTLKSIDLEIKKGEVVALVGQSGSGKSTIVQLLERFYDSTEGQILFDNIDIKEYNQQKLHQTIGFVAQEPTLFSGTLKENITYGVQNYTQEDIDNAMKLANAYEFVSNKQVFPDGLDTIVGERGVKLSGGQKQRIAIARALIKNPKILIFDEATSALDSESEFQVQSAIDGLVSTGQKTIIIIAHRLSTIINSNKIVVIQNGEIVEQGRHQDLIEKNGIYKQLIERQLT